MGWVGQPWWWWGDHASCQGSQQSRANSSTLAEGSQQSRAAAAAGKPQPLPKHCQQVATSLSVRAQWLEGQNLSRAPKAVLCYTPHTAEPVYIKPLLVCLSRKSTANRWRQMCLSRSVSQSLTWDLRPLVQLKNSVNTLERANQWGQRGTSRDRSPAKSYKRSSSQTNLFHALCSVSSGGVQTTNQPILTWEEKRFFIIIF